MTITRDDVISWLNECGRVIAENKDYLTQLDSAIGDADHGANMDRGFKAALAKLPSVADKDIGTLFKSPRDLSSSTARCFKAFRHSASILVEKVFFVFIYLSLINYFL